MAKTYGETMAFSGGAEETPVVQVSRFDSPDSLNHNELTLTILQGQGSRVQLVQISPKTLQAILDWYHEKK